MSQTKPLLGTEDVTNIFALSGR